MAGANMISKRQTGMVINRSASKHVLSNDLNTPNVAATYLHKHEFQFISGAKLQLIFYLHDGSSTVLCDKVRKTLSKMFNLSPINRLANMP